MLHEKPVLVAFAATQRPAKLGSPASTSSSADSAIGTTSPASISPSGTHEQQQVLHIAYAIQPDDPNHKPHVYELTLTNDFDADIAEITRRIGAQALLISTTEDLRQILHPMAAIHATRHFNVGEVMDSTLRQRLPSVFSQYVSVENLPDSHVSAESFAQLATVDRCRAIMTIINEKDLELLNHVETINEGYNQFVNFERRIDSSLVVKIKGLPWSASDQDIALFFAGLNITPGGIALCLGNEGRRSGEALVCFECNAHRELALRRHRKFLHNRYIEIYRATKEEFNSCFAMVPNTESLQFIQKDAAMIIRMRGLPFDCTEADILSFFGVDGDAGIMQDGIMFVNRPDGRPIGDAFVLFVDDESGRRALLKHKKRIGNRYIELFRTTQAEVQQIVSRAQQRPQTNSVPQATATANQLLSQFQNSTANQQQAQLQPVQLTMKRDCLRMRGLPYEAKPEQIAEFLGPHAKQIVDQGIHMIYNSQGSPSGEAFIQMRSDQAANTASLALHNKNMEIGKKRRYIEVFQCSLDEMQSLLNPLQPLTNSLQLPLGLATSVNTPMMQPNLQLAPHLQNLYRHLSAANNFGHHPMQHFPLHAGLIQQPQMSLLGIPTAFGNGLQMFANDPSQIHIQQQQLNAGLLDPVLLQQQLNGLPAMPTNGLDLATAAALLHHQQSLLGVNGMQPLKDFGANGFLDLKQKLDIQHHC